VVRIIFRKLLSNLWGKILENHFRTYPEINWNSLKYCQATETSIIMVFYWINLISFSCAMSDVPLTAIYFGNVQGNVFMNHWEVRVNLLCISLIILLLAGVLSK